MTSNNQTHDPNMIIDSHPPTTSYPGLSILNPLKPKNQPTSS